VSEVKKCPKCGGDMQKADYLSGYGAARLVKFGDIRGDKVIPLYCTKCGYIELYRKMKEKMRVSHE
jgi:predicted nucleic-acid-binding Zn-ribbon protein